MPAAGNVNAPSGGGKTGGSPGSLPLNFTGGAGKGGPGSVTGTLPVGGARITQLPAPTGPNGQTNPAGRPMPGQAGQPGSSNPQPILSPTVPPWAMNTNGGFL